MVWISGGIACFDIKIFSLDGERDTGHSASRRQKDPSRISSFKVFVMRGFSVDSRRVLCTGLADFVEWQYIGEHSCEAGSALVFGTTIRMIDYFACHST